ncbi:MAG: hypothetical protein KatS3mg110_3041 [Pirellulaceae bacterium]|nr:MAG: hypothetical protein KatS3mg110_3041 [Pirellulaceae bacterium]
MLATLTRSRMFPRAALDGYHPLLSGVLLGVMAVAGGAGMALMAAAGEPGEPMRLERLTEDGQFKLRPSWSPDGRILLFARVGVDSIRTFRRDCQARVEQPLSEENHMQWDAVYSPDGQWIAVTHDAASPNQGNMDVWLLDVNSGKWSVLIGDAGKLSHEEYPSWSPDGKRLVFTSTRDGNPELYVIDREGKNLKRLTTYPGTDTHPNWSPDGTRIAWATDRWGSLEIAIMSVEGELLERLTQNDWLDDYPCWSPDGRYLAWMSHQGGQYEIYVMDLESRQTFNASCHPAADMFPSWRSDGRLCWVSQRDGVWDIYLTEP